MTREEILSHVDHTLLKPEATWPQIQTLCDEAIANHTASICINTCYVKQAVEYMAGRIPVCCVVGFPLGAMDTASKAFEAKTAIENGAAEVDMVINIGRLKNKEYGSAMMGRAGIAYTTGFKAIMTAIPYLIGMFIFSAIAGRIQEVGAARNINSIPELFHYRFSRNARCILALMIVFTMMGTVAAQVTATATIIKMLGSEFGISYEAGALVATIIFIIYTAASGLFGVVYTDVLQFFMLIIFVYILIPISSVRYLGNFSVFWQNLDKSYLVPHINGSILGDIVTYLVFTQAGAEMWQRAFAAKNKKSATRGMFWGTSIYMVTIALVFFMGLVAQQILPNVVAQYGSSDADKQNCRRSQKL